MVQAPIDLDLARHVGSPETLDPSRGRDRLAHQPIEEGAGFLPSWQLWPTMLAHTIQLAEFVRENAVLEFRTPQSLIIRGALLDPT